MALLKLHVREGYDLTRCLMGNPLYYHSLASMVAIHIKSLHTVMNDTIEEL